MQRRLEDGGGEQDTGCADRTTDAAGFGADPAVCQLTGWWVRPPPSGWRQEMQPLPEQLPEVDPDGVGPGENEPHDSFQGVGRWLAARQWQTGRLT